MKIRKVLAIVIEVLVTPKMLWSALTFKVFSITSYKMLQLIRSESVNPELIVDVGANKGQFAVAAAMIVPEARILSFEPDPNTYSNLQSNTKKLKNITCFQTALGEKSGDIEFNRNTYSLSSSILPMTEQHLSSFPAAVEKEVISIPITTLDAVLMDFDLTQTVLLKLDVQGYEKAVLQGARNCLMNVDYLVLEASFRPLYDGEMLFNECVELMSSYGFEVVTALDLLKDPETGRALQIDLLFKNVGIVAQ